MRKLLLQLDSSPHPSVFDRIVAFDGGADEVMSYGGITDNAVRDLVHGTIFTRGPKDLHNTAIFIGGTDMAAGERLLAAVRKTFFGPMRVSVMLDSSGSGEAMRWNLINAWPQEWNGAPLNAMSQELAIETLVLAHEGLNRETSSGSAAA